MTRSGLFIASKTTMKYRKLSEPYWLMNKPLFKAMLAGKTKPFYLGLHFVRGSRHQWDFINPAQTIQDEMVKAGWLDDDNVDEVLPVPLNIDGHYWRYDKTNSGVYITVMDSLCDDYSLTDLITHHEHQ